MNENDFFKRKESIVIKDFETAFKSYEHLSNKVTSLRQWTVTLSIAVMGFFLTNRVSVTNMIIISSSCFVSFLLFELRERSSMSFDKREILKFENIFMEENNDKYIKSIIDYKFRDLLLDGLCEKEKRKHLKQSLKKPIVYIWYSLWFSIWVIIVGTTTLKTININSEAKYNNLTEAITMEKTQINQPKEVKKESIDKKVKIEGQIK